SIVALDEDLLGDELVGESTRFPAQTVAPARDLAQSVFASLHRARLRYVEGLVMLKSGFKAAAVIKRGCRFGHGGLGCACSPLILFHSFQPLLVFPLGKPFFSRALRPASQVASIASFVQMSSM